VESLISATHGHTRQGLSIAGIRCKATIAPHRANDNIGVFLAATGDAHHIFGPLNPHDVNALPGRLDHFPRKNYSGSIRATDFKLRPFDRGLDDHALLVVENLGLADTASYPQHYDDERCLFHNKPSPLLGFFAKNYLQFATIQNVKLQDIGPFDLDDISVGNEDHPVEFKPAHQTGIAMRSASSLTSAGMPG